MAEIILARHGETEWNRAEVFRGRTDIDLNETGRKEAEFLAQYLDSIKIEAVYSSPLRRALQTAEVIARQNKLEVNIAPGLIDFDYGQWQGLSNRNVQDKYKELCAVWTSHPERVKMPGGESLDDVRKRAVVVVDEVIARHKGTTVLVSHRVVNKVLICALLGLDNSHFWNIRQDTGAISIFAYERNRFILTKHNETCFLESIKKAELSDF